MTTSDNNGIVQKKLDRMKLGILLLEKENLKTREKANEQMADAIRKMIIDEANKNY